MFMPVFYYLQKKWKLLQPISNKIQHADIHARPADMPVKKAESLSSRDSAKRARSSPWLKYRRDGDVLVGIPVLPDGSPDAVLIHNRFLICSFSKKKEIIKENC